MSNDEAPPKDISIVGHEGKTFRYADVAKTVVRIKDQYYRKDSTEIVKVLDRTGKMRFYRKESPYLVKLEDGSYAHKAHLIRTEDGIYLDPNSDSVIKLNDKYVRKTFCVQIDKKWYLKTDPTIVRDGRNGTFCLLADAVELAKSVYGSTPVFGHKKNVIPLKSGGYAYAADVYKLYDFATDELVYYAKSEVSGKNTVNVVIDFQDKTNPQEDRLFTVTALSTEAVANCVYHTIVEGVTGAVYIPKSKVEYFKDAAERYIMPRLLADREQVRKKMNQNFSDLDENENTAKVFKNIPRPWPGKQEIYKPASFRAPIIGNTFALTGGLKYSFGVEIETSQGQVPNPALDATALFAVGDRSIGAAEYVTPPMKGDAGIEMLRKQLAAIQKSTLVDDRCGIHVHVGSLFQPTTSKAKPTPKEAPSFNKDFIMNAIRLGCYLEEELFQSLPKSRIPTLYHCHSIRRWAGITKENFDAYVGAYIFGPKEQWVNSKGEAVPLFKMADYSLGPNRNQNSEVGVWADGRYKWLNLIHSYTRSRHQTIEFRIFSPTTVFDKVYAYLLTSMAFTYVADNKPALIVPGVTLSQVFKTSFTKYPDIITFLDKFYEERKAKFNRKTIYPKLDLPFLK